MKQFKKMKLMMVCVCAVLGCAACGNRDEVDNGANQTENANGTDTTLVDVDKYINSFQNIDSSSDKL